MEKEGDRAPPDGDERPTKVDELAPIHRDRTRLEAGYEVADYIVDGEIGHGGMGVVYSATHKVIGKRAALKVLRTEVSKSPTTVARFIQEARAVNQIGHPNIIDIFAFGTLPDGRAYHLMDLLIGESLRQRLRHGSLHPSEAASVIDEIASALAAAHERGYVHRDLKPDNVYLIDIDGRWPEVKLLDFGLAKLMPEAGVAAFTTKTGMMLGTPEYMSPEQARGIGVDHRTDIYALGIVMFEILAGQRPFPSTEDGFAMLQCHAEMPPPSLALFLPTLPVEMVQLVDAMLAKDPSARPSLTAVRTVIKRLRAVSLPSMSAAGLEISLPSNPGVTSPLGITASRVGATALLPDDWGTMPQRIPLTSPGVAFPSLRSKSSSTPPTASERPQRPSQQPLSTTLGASPPPVPPPSRQLAPRHAGGSRVWLIIGALLAIAAGVALAIVLVGT